MLGAREESVVSPHSPFCFLFFFDCVFFKGFDFFPVFYLRFDRVLVKDGLPYCRVEMDTLHKNGI